MDWRRLHVLLLHWWHSEEEDWDAHARKKKFEVHLAGLTEGDAYCMGVQQGAWAWRQGMFLRIFAQIIDRQNGPLCMEHDTKASICLMRCRPLN